MTDVMITDAELEAIVQPELPLWTLDGAMDPELKAKLAAKLLARSVVIEGTGCRRWQGARNPKGYGQIRVGGKAKQVHRVAHEVWIGPIPDGFEIDHVYERGCRYRDCIEPSHLEAVTHHENILRKPTVGRTRTHCAAGHEFTEANTKIVARRDRPRPRKVCRRCFNDDRNAWRARKREAAKNQENQ